MFLFKRPYSIDFTENSEYIISKNVKKREGTAMKWTQRWISLFFCVALVSSFMPVSALAEQIATLDDVILDVVTGEVSEADVIEAVPDVIGGKELLSSTKTTAPDDVNVGDHITFGSKNGTSITWEVLEIDGTNALLFCDYVVDFVEYGNVSSYNYNSAFAAWCSDYFSSGVFSDAEKEAVLSTTINNASNQHLFFLSRDEYNRYFPDGDSGYRMLFPGVSGTLGAYGLGTVTATNDNLSYWLRSATSSLWVHLAQFSEKVYIAAYSLNLSMYRCSYGVCPALYIDLSKWDGVIEDGTDDGDDSGSLAVISQYPKHHGTLDGDDLRISITFNQEVESVQTGIGYGYFRIVRQIETADGGIKTVYELEDVENDVIIDENTVTIDVSNANWITNETYCVLMDNGVITFKDTNERTGFSGTQWVFEMTNSKWSYFSFSNTVGDFFNPDETRTNDTGNYLSLLERLYPWYKILLRHKEATEWQGSCYGFTALEGMVNTNLIDASTIDVDADTLPEVSKPKDAHSVRELLNYYLLTQYIPDLRGTMYKIGTRAGKNALQNMTDAVLNGTPYMFAYRFKNGSSGGWHAITLEGGKQLANGSYELTGYDNRYYGLEIYLKENDHYVSTGRPFTVEVQISADFSSCSVVVSDANYVLWYDGIYRKYNRIEEKVIQFEPVSDFSKFAQVNPTMVTRSVLSVTDEVSPVLYFQPEKDVASSFILTNGAGETILDGMSMEELESSSYIEGHWYTNFRSILEYVTDPNTGEIYVETVNAPVGLMATLSQPVEGDSYRFSDLTGGASISYVGSEGYASADVGDAESVVLDLSSNTVAIEGNTGEFSVSFAAADENMVTVVGSTDTDGDITVAATEQGVVLDAPKGSYAVTFTDQDSQELTVAVQSTGGSVTVTDPSNTDETEYATEVQLVMFDGRTLTSLITCAADTHNSALLATYSASGQMLEANTYPLAEGINQIKQAIDATDVFSVRVFLLNNRYEPQDVAVAEINRNEFRAEFAEALASLTYTSNRDSLDCYADAERIDGACSDAVLRMFNFNLMIGDGKNFNPKAIVTRAEIAQIIYVALNGGIDDGASAYADEEHFFDVTADDWYAGYAHYCAEYNLGPASGYFYGSDPVTVAEAAKMIMCAMGYSSEACGFVGANWYNNVLSAAEVRGLLDGFNYSTSSYIPRQWLAVMFCNAIDNAQR